MEKDNRIPVDKEIFKKLTLLADFLKKEVIELSNYAFNEFFNLILDNPAIFLEEMGQYENLKKILT